MKARSERSFPPESRLRKSADFQRLRNSSIKIHTRHFLVVLEPSPTGRSRLGITVSTKIDKRAVIRNRTKRLVREVFRISKKHLRESFDIVVIARKNASGCTFDEIKKELLGALTQRGLLVNESGGRKEK